jgi:hypothetical protein
MRQVTIYKITFPDGRFYIGSTLNYANRVGCHASLSSKKSLPSGKETHLYKKFREMGFSRKWFSVVDICNEDKRFELENKWINQNRILCINKGTDASAPSRGSKRSQEAKGNAVKTRLENMPYFFVVCPNSQAVLMKTNNYDLAAMYTGESRDGIRKKLRNNRNMTKFIYQYAGGGLSR